MNRSDGVIDHQKSPHFTAQQLFHSCQLPWFCVWLQKHFADSHIHKTLHNWYSTEAMTNQWPFQNWHNKFQIICQLLPTIRKSIGSCYRLMLFPYIEVSVPDLGMSSLSPIHTALTENSELKLNSEMNTRHCYLVSPMKWSLRVLLDVTLGPPFILFTQKCY